MRYSSLLRKNVKVVAIIKRVHYYSTFPLAAGYHNGHKWCIMPDMSRKQKPLTLANVGKRVIFKIRKESEPQLVGGLNLEGVYQVLTAKADYGRNIRIADLAGLTAEGTSRTYNTLLDIPTVQAKRIEVYLLP
jgi:hypothetical protein